MLILKAGQKLSVLWWLTPLLPPKAYPCGVATLQTECHSLTQEQVKTNNNEILYCLNKCSFSNIMKVWHEQWWNGPFAWYMTRWPKHWFPLLLAYNLQCVQWTNWTAITCWVFLEINSQTHDLYYQGGHGIQMHANNTTCRFVAKLHSSLTCEYNAIQFLHPQQISEVHF